MEFPANSPAFPVVSEGGATQPTLSVSGRVDGGGYTVSAGARSITIMAEAGATLSTTVKKASDNSTVTVTDSTTTTPDWTAPAGGSTGESVQVTVTATKDGLTSQVSFTERIAGSGGSASWVDLLDYDFEDVTTASAISSGTSTLAFESSADTLDVTATAFSSNNGSLTPTNGVGLQAAGGAATGATTFAFDWVSELVETWDAEYAAGGHIAVDVFVESVAYVSAGDYIFAGLSPNTTHNSGGTRIWYFARDTVSTDEDRRTRNNTSNGSIIDTVAIKTSRVLTFTLQGGADVHLSDVSGSTAPSDPRPFSSGMTFCGADSAAQQATSRVFTSAAYAVMSTGQQTSYTIKRLRVRRRQ